MICLSLENNESKTDSLFSPYNADISITEHEIDHEVEKSNSEISLSKRDHSIIKLYSQGLSSYKIAEQLQINRHTVTKVLRDNNIKLRTKAHYDTKRKNTIIKLYKEGKSFDEISEIVGVSKYSIRLTLEKEKIVFNIYDKELLKIARYVQMKNRGYDNLTISKFLNITQKQLNKLLRNSGIKISVVRRKVEKEKKINEHLSDIIEKKLRGMKAKDIAICYEIDLVLLKDVLSEFGLSRK